MIPESPGIYMIKNEINGKVYIGSSVNLRARWNTHRTLLNTNHHKNRNLQAAWNEFGESSFVFIVIELVKQKEALSSFEQKWMDHYSPTDDNLGYNLYGKAALRGVSCLVKKKYKRASVNYTIDSEVLSAINEVRNLPSEGRNLSNMVEKLLREALEARGIKIKTKKK